jgi:hypothetical protein
VKQFLNLIKTEPALVTGVVQAVLALLAGTVVTLTATQAGAILAVTTAILALVAAIATRPFQVAALTGLTTSLVTLLIAFGVPHVDAGTVSTLNAAITAVAALIVRLHVTPVVSLPKPPPPTTSPSHPPVPGP